MYIVDYLLNLGFENPLNAENTYFLRGERPIKVKILRANYMAISFPDRSCPKMDNVPLPKNIKHADILFRGIIGKSALIRKQSLNNYINYLYGSNKQLHSFKDISNI